MREAFRPYTRVISIASGAPITNVSLIDGGQQPLDCNYVSIEALQTGGTTDDFFVAIASGVVGQTPVHASGIGSSTSGILGLTASVHGGTVVFSLDSSDTVSEVQISHNHTQTVPFAINYGNVRVVNPVADIGRAKGV